MKEVLKKKDVYIGYQFEELTLLYVPYIFPNSFICKNLFVVGTFKIIPISLYHLYTIHGLIRV